MIYSEWRRYRACDRKMRWPSSVVARNWATLLGWKHGKPYEPYRCSWCDGWHVATVRDASDTPRPVDCSCPGDEDGGHSYGCRHWPREVSA